MHAITALSAGGASDVFLRVLSDQFQKRTGQPIVVENRPGGALNIGGQACADAPPDGYTICLLPVETLSYNQFLFKKLSYDPNAFEPITNMFFVTAVLVVNSSLNVRSLDDLAAVSKAKPGTLSYMSPAMPLVFFMENWRRQNGVDIVKVPYKGGADAANAILGGSTPVAFQRARQFHSAHPRRHDDRACGRHRHPLAAACRTCRPCARSATRGRWPRPISAWSRRPEHRRRSSPSCTTSWSRSPASEAFAERNMISLGLLPILNTPEEFARYLKDNRTIAARIVKESGLEPQ